MRVKGTKGALGQPGTAYSHAPPGPRCGVTGPGHQLMWL